MDDYPYYMDPEEKRERAERVFEEELEVIAERLSIHPRHTELVRDTTNLVLACEEIPKLERGIAAISYNSYVKGFNAFGGYPLSSLRKEILWYEMNSFSFHLPGDIVIGSVGEDFDGTLFIAGMRAELGHAVYETLKDFRAFALNLRYGSEVFDENISEFYDFICWKCAESTLDEDELHIIDAFRDSHRLVRKPYGYVNHLEHKSEQRHHVAFKEIIIPVLDALAEHVALPYKECLPLLVDAGAKAMYDKRTDFSSPQRFAEGVIERLPVYFPRNFREKLLKVLLS